MRNIMAVIRSPSIAGVEALGSWTPMGAQSVSSAYLRLKARVTKKRRLTRRVRRSEEALLKSKKRPDPF